MIIYISIRSLQKESPTDLCSQLLLVCTLHFLLWCTAKIFSSSAVFKCEFISPELYLRSCSRCFRIRLSLPKLSCIGCNKGGNAEIGFSVENIGSSLLPIHLLNLSESSSITIAGNIYRYQPIRSFSEFSHWPRILPSVSFPLLRTVLKQFEINSTSNQPLDIDLPALTHVSQLCLRGNITRFSILS